MTNTPTDKEAVDEFSTAEIDSFVRSFGSRPDEAPYPMNDGDQLFALRALVHLSAERDVLKADVNKWQVSSVEAHDELYKLQAQLSAAQAAGTFSDGVKAAANGLCEFLWRDLSRHLSAMYPTVWMAIPQSCRNSMRGLIANSIIAEQNRIRALTPPPAQAQGDDEWAKALIEFACRRGIRWDSDAEVYDLVPVAEVLEAFNKSRP